MCKLTIWSTQINGVGVKWLITYVKHKQETGGGISINLFFNPKNHTYLKQNKNPTSHSDGILTAIILILTASGINAPNRPNIGIYTEF